MAFDNQIAAMISVGAAVAANCHPCLRHHAAKAREAGVSEEDIEAAAEVGKAVRTGAAKQMDQLVATLGRQATAPQTGCTTGCGC